MKAPIEVSHFQEADEFSDFLWMAEVEMEEFDKRYYEELLIEECIQEYEDALMESEGNHDSDCITIQLTSDHIVNDIYCQGFPTLMSKLNPNAAVFVPRQFVFDKTEIQR